MSLRVICVEQRCENTFVDYSGPVDKIAENEAIGTVEHQETSFGQEFKVHDTMSVFFVECGINWDVDQSLARFSIVQP